MENDIFMNAGIPPPMQFEQSSLAALSSWQSLSSSAMKVQYTAELNSSSDLFNPTWGKSTVDRQSVHNFDSGLGSIVSSPVASNSNIPNDNYFIRELIGKLGNIGSPAPEISPHPQTLITSSANTSCYSTPMSSPPNINRSLMNRNFPNFLKSIPLSSSVAEFSADPGFAERAAKFSCFGSRSFNSRTSQIRVNGNEFNNRSNLSLMANGKLQRVASSPSLKVLGLQNGVQGIKKHSLMELTNSVEESTVSEQTPHGEPAGKACSHLNSRKRKASSKGKGKESASSPNTPLVVEDNESLNPKRCKASENDKDGDGPAKAEEEPSGNGGDEKENKNSPKPPEPLKDYIHVRARRGQATDRHSLAERVRREKISERMKLLQDLVPGCNKVTGKALMLDEIINYVQSLQRQVEFLSMKMASVNTRMDCSTNHLMSKDMFQSSNTLSHPIYPIDSSRSAYYGHHQPQQNPAQHNNVSNGSVSHSSADHPLDSALCQYLGTQLPLLNDFGETLAEEKQYPTFSGDDLQTIVQMGFGQNLNRETVLLSQSQSLKGSSQVAHMKVEL